MLVRKITLQDYKTLKDVSIELGRVNVFIGPNGVGKTSILEAFGLISATMVERLDDRLIESRGVRLGTPYLYKSSFKNERVSSCMSFSLTWDGDDRKSYQYRFSLNAPLDQTKYTWKFHSEALTFAKSGKAIFGRSGHSSRFDDFDGIKISKDRSMYGVLKDIITPSLEQSGIDWTVMDICRQISSYGIYAPNTLMLRGLVEDRVLREPVGLYGGRLPEAVAELVCYFNDNYYNSVPEVSRETLTLCRQLLFCTDWYDALSAGARNRNILSPNVNTQRQVLRFRDKYMNSSRNIITAYDANEGALYSLFLACLLFHPSAPSVFAIDNVDYGLNPRVARKIASIFSAYAKATDKTILLTTHNPLFLDGLDIRNDSIRIFTVERNRKGHTTINRIQLNEQLLQSAESSSLSHLWITGQLGGMPAL